MNYCSKQDEGEMQENKKFWDAFILLQNMSIKKEL